eukprot:gene14029-16536_t
MFINITVLKQILKEEVMDVLDHKCLEADNTTFLTPSRVIPTIILDGIMINSSDSYQGCINVNGPATMSISNSLITGCTSVANGGAILANQVALDINNSTFSNNFAYLSGGSIYTNAKVTVNQSIFNGSSSVISGGAIHQKDWQSVIQLLYSTFTSCRSAQGGAVYFWDQEGSINATNCLFSNNYATDGAAIYNVGADTGFWMNFTGTIFQSNTAIGTGAALFFPFQSEGAGNIIGGKYYDCLSSELIGAFPETGVCMFTWKHAFLTGNPFTPAPTATPRKHQDNGASILASNLTLVALSIILSTITMITNIF